MRMKTILASSIVTLSSLGIITANAATISGTNTQNTTPPPSPPSQSQPHHGHHHHGHGKLMRDVAEVLDMQPSAVLAELKQGKSLAQVAQSKGVSEATLISKLKSNLQERLDKKVENGDMSADKKAKILSRFDATIKERLNRTGGFGHSEKR